ncbi:hypothetical protein EJ06DRAFT_127537 [Trichodelitschia bisporula]|uniref:Tafazzin n=1 Tax=Trichodelitschia bisporula TaxID=703511 RepID=A0A6G1HQQ8_9PEZI|nr:hypothetical protein EJ06DRAFT_127537 [Trichodelitschia bisporula]
MPKKHTRKFTPGSYLSRASASTASHGASSSSSTAGSTRSVNERLEQLRLEQAPRATLEQRQQVTEIATTHSMPPQLRRILQIPETAPPPPRAGRRVPRAARTPGPPPPQSWLQGDTSSSSSSSLTPDADEMPRKQAARFKPDWFNRISTLIDGVPFPLPKTLLGQSLKATARNWETIAAGQSDGLGRLPAHLKGNLLAYLGLYCGEKGIDIDFLRALFRAEVAEDGATGSEELQVLDLSGLISENLSMPSLVRYFEKKDTAVNSSSSQGENTDAESSFVADSWENSIPTGLHTPRFPNLTRLSLARAGRFASWQSLLHLSDHLSTITHLSLAYWPKPQTLMSMERLPPNVPPGEYELGDDELQDGYDLISRISRNTYCLKWLDLQGCGQWLDMLTWEPVEPQGWVSDRNSPPPLSRRYATYWSTHWKQLEYVNLSQAWIPDSRSIPLIQSCPANMLSIQYLKFLRELAYKKDGGDFEVRHLQFRGLGNRLAYDGWMAREQKAETLGAVVKGRVGSHCVVDRGWPAPPGIPIVIDETELNEAEMAHRAAVFELLNR